MFTKLKDLQSRKSDKGFTIIEVMIVLAIAGLILLIVFLAVPALQRSSRNTQRKNDAAAIAGAIANFISNNNGTVPSLVSDSATNNVNVQATASATANVETAKLGYYTSSGTIGQAAAAGQDGNIYISQAVAANPKIPSVVAPGGGNESATKVSTNTVAIIYGQDCTSPTPVVNARTAAIYYVTEPYTVGGTPQCTEQ